MATLVENPVVVPEVDVPAKDVDEDIAGIAQIIRERGLAFGSYLNPCGEVCVLGARLLQLGDGELGSVERRQRHGQLVEQLRYDPVVTKIGNAVARKAMGTRSKVASEDAPGVVATWSDMAYGWGTDRVVEFLEELARA